MADRTFTVTTQQWARFNGIIMSSLAELLVAGVLNEVADEVELCGGRREVDLICRTEERNFTVEVKTAWWHVDDLVVGHSPVRDHQVSDLVALVGRFDVTEKNPSLKGISKDGIAIEPDRFFYLVPYAVMIEHARPDGKSAARSLVDAEVIAPYSVDLDSSEPCISRERLVELLQFNTAAVEALATL